MDRAQGNATVQMSLVVNITDQQENASENAQRVNGVVYEPCKVQQATEQAEYNQSSVSVAASCCE